ncbi:peptidase S8/S53 subtilisin kexin sedolisin [Vibrio albus]|uniref:Peptidase S8/S53 subtilisin kexin sedolisin n=1 Tax=Vibrio albus TaxID=2200953 RepID=A0A2U3B799_9VIBR|nr:S8 family serine peptidase [Vibrio albus]PWI32661.1 peptidase S8/S53 subtilisin kexin sedolisin [Vibrio albus]
MLRTLIYVLLSCLFWPGLLMAAENPPSERYIVVLKAGTGSEMVAREVATTTHGRVGYIYKHVFSGFSITVPPQAVTGIINNPNVDYIEPDRQVTLSAQSVPSGIRRIFADSNAALSIDAVDDFRVDSDVAVLDTGIDFQHGDLNVVGGANCLQTTGGGPPWRRTYYCDSNVSSDDDHYHGTHVAGIIGALDNNVGVVGVAPGVRLWAVKILDSGGSGYDSGIIAGIDWVIDHGDIEVINMSIGGPGVSTAFKDAIDSAVANGVVVVVAAGNESDDANYYSPAFVPSAITVSALEDFDGLPGYLAQSGCYSGEDDTLAYYSNWGSAVDIAAPGSCINSTVPLEYGSYGVLSGTSMAAPHVAGAAALLVSGANPPTDGNGVAAVFSGLVAASNNDWTDDSGDGKQEPLLDVSSIVPVLVSTGDSNNVAPNADFGFSCSDLVCTFTDNSVDSDGSIVGWSWDFGNGYGSSEQQPVHAYTAQGNYTVTLTVTDNDGASDSVSKTVSVTQPVDPGLTISGMTPDTINSGSSVELTVSGSGFLNGANISFSGGSGPTPEVSGVVVSADGQTITASVLAKAGGPPRARYWDITVTNPDGSSVTLEQALTVLP